MMLRRFPSQLHSKSSLRRQSRISSHAPPSLACVTSGSATLNSGLEPTLNWSDSLSTTASPQLRPLAHSVISCTVGQPDR